MKPDIWDHRMGVFNIGEWLLQNMLQGGAPPAIKGLSVGYHPHELVRYIYHNPKLWSCKPTWPTN